MQIVYRAENLFDAHLVRGRLASEGVEAFVQGEYLAGAMGELPVSGLLGVAVHNENIERALELLQVWEQEADAIDALEHDAEQAGDEGDVDPDSPHTFLA